MNKNVIVGQSGGPTAVINSSLVGVFKTARDRGADKVYGMLHGIQGLLDRQYVDLSQHIKSDLDIDLLKRTPSSFLGSCRYKLPTIENGREIYEKIFAILDELEIVRKLLALSFMNSFPECFDKEQLRMDYSFNFDDVPDFSEFSDDFD